MSKRLFTVALVFFAVVGAEALAKALEPLIALGPYCAAGSARGRTFLVFEDRDGDGGYDFITSYDCNGDVRGRPWNASMEEDPFIPLPTDKYIGHLPDDVVGASYEFIFNREQTGLYSWEVIERTSGLTPTSGIEVCRTSRNVNMELTCTCPPNQDGGEDLD